MGMAADKLKFAQNLESGKLRLVSSNTGTKNALQMKIQAASAGVPRAQQLGQGSALPARMADSRQTDIVALTSAASVWAQSSTRGNLDRAGDVRKMKLNAVIEFFIFLEKDIFDVRPGDVRDWQIWLEKEKGLKATTIYNRCSHLSSFFNWIIKQEQFKKYIEFNPVKPAFPKCPTPYQSTGTKSLSDDAVKNLWRVMENVRKKGTATGLRDYVIFRFFAASGDRRAEILNLRGCDVELTNSGLIYFARKKGGKRVGKTIKDKSLVRALLSYIKKSGRKERDVFGRDVPLWLAHDRAGSARSQALVVKSEAPRGMTSHAFAKAMKSYAEKAKIYDFHLHRIRHTFARVVAEETGSLSQAQEALDHQNMSTTRIYVESVEIKENFHSGRLKGRAKIKE